MVVAELIKALQAMPQDLKVISEGCDCTTDEIEVLLLSYDAAYGWNSTTGDPTVLIGRLGNREPRGE